MAQTAPGFVQVASAVPQSPRTSVAVSFPSAQTAGNLNVVVVGWNDTTAQVQSVTDTAGNTYVRAVGPTVRNGLGTQSIYYAANIKAAGAGANSVTAAFNVSAQYVDLRIAEYRGISQSNPVDVVAGAQGSSSSNSSGTVSTTNANDLLVGANLVATRTTGAGASFTSRIITSPDGDILEDRVVTATGSYSATAPTNGGAYVMQMVAFRTAAGASDTQPPSAPAGLAANAISSGMITLDWTASTDDVGVTSYLVERCSGAACTGFNQIGTSTTASYIDSAVSPSVSYRYRVRATDGAANLSGYSNVASATTPAAPDTQAPTAPSGLTATSVSSSQVTLAWTASTDNVGVATYLIDRCQGTGCASFSQVGTSASPGYVDATVAASAFYSYRISATDAAGNRSAPSNVWSVSTPAAPAGIALVQHAGLDAGTADSAALSFASANAAGNFIAVAIRAGRTGQVLTVTDTRGNTYRKAVQLDETSDNTSLALYYAENIGGGANTVTVATSIAGGTLRFAVLEYAGVAPASSLDAVASARDTSAAPNSGPVTVTTAGELLIGLVTTANPSTPTAGAGFAIQERVPTAGVKLLVEGSVQPTPGSVSASAALSSPDVWGALIATFRPASAGSPDTQAPTTPAALGVTPGSSSQVTLAWTASTDNVGVTGYLVERCAGVSCSTFAQVGTSPTAAYTDTAVSPSTSYSYRVRATDAANNLSGYSNVASVTTPAAPDTQAPTAPAGLAATAGSTSQVTLGWTASTDNVGVTGYLVERCAGAACSTFAQVGTSPAAAYTDTTVSPSTTYSYRVRATDAANNLSGYSNVASATTPAAATIAFVQVNASTPQSSPSNVTLPFLLSQNAGDLNVVAIGWNADSGVIQSVTDTVGNTYGLAVGPTARLGFGTQSIYYAANIGSAAAGANSVTVTFDGPVFHPDIRIAEYSGVAPNAPLHAVAAADGNGTLSDSGLTPVSVVPVLVVGANMVSSLTTGAGAGFTSRVVTSPDGDILEDRVVDVPGDYSATAAMTSGVWIMQLAGFRAGTVIPDTQPPTAPAGLAATAGSSSQVTLGWTASTDNVGVTGYLVERCTGIACSTFAQVGTSSTAAYIDTAVSPSTSYSYRVRATDAANNLSGYSNVAGATTPAAPDTQRPTAPAGLAATAGSSSQVTLGWTASTDNVGVTGYLVERCTGIACSTFAQVGTSSTAAYTDATVGPSTSYSYRVRATDAANNLSGYSNVASATTPGTVAIAFVQVNSATPQSPQSAVTVTYTSAQLAGDLNVVAVGWNDTTAQVQSVADTLGNTYVRAIGPTVRTGLGTQSIYYASNIAAAGAGVNKVTVTFNVAAQYADIRIAEYRGIDPVNPLDTAVGAQGSGSPSSSGTATTTNGNDLIVGANLVATRTTGAGASFTSRVITVPDGDIFEDRIVSAAGSYVADAPLNGGGWVMQMAAFRAGSVGSDTQPPTAPTGLTATAVSSSQVTLSWTAATDNVGVASYLVERCTGPTCTTFAQIGTSATPAFLDSGLAQGTSFSYRVRAADAGGNIGSYSGSATATTPTPDLEPPSAPGTPTVTPVSGTQIDLVWGPATDNVGVTGYRVERCQGAGCSVFVKLSTTAGTSFTDTGLTPNTSYTYVILATDAAGNLGPYSNPSSATTLATVPELVAAYSFNEGAGPTAVDTSGNANHGSIGSATWTAAGQFGGALSFNGSNAKVVIPDSASLHLTTGVTLEAWIKPTVVNSGWRDVVYKGNDIYYLESTTLSNGGVPAAGVTVVSSGNSNTYGPSKLTAGVWTHLAETYDGATVRLYVNGAQVASTARSGQLASSSNPLEIGGDSIFGQFFEGLIDEVRVYNVARTPTQIQADMETPIGETVPVVSLSTTAVDFGLTAVGVASSPTDVTLKNIGGAPLTIGSIGVAGANASDFSASNTCPATLADGASCTIRVVFTAGASGLRAGQITVQDDASGAPHVIALTGSGVDVLVTPGTATLTPGGTQQFSAASNGASTFAWSVDGVEGGSPAAGTISATGLYAAPATVGSHTITATRSDQTASGSATVYVVSYTGTFTFHNDNARTGANLNETVLTPANVNSTRFGKLLGYDIDGQAYASPLYVPAVQIPGVGSRNVVFVATEHDSVYAFDADGLTSAPLWHRSFINPAAGITTVSPNDVGECCDITPEIGISGTPVIDPATGTLYVVAKTKEVSGGTTTFVQRLHALDITTGAERSGSPVVIQATVPGTGQGSVGGQLTFLSLRENQRPALLLSNGVVYIPFGSHGDQQPYHGWVLGYDATTLQQTMAYCATPNNEGAGIWMAGAGAAADADGNLYVVTGDGSFDANAGGKNFGDSYIKLSPSGAVLDYFTPHDQGTLDNGNIDLGAGGIVLLPDQPGTHPRMLISAGKNGTIDLIDRDGMGHYNASNDNQIVQTLSNIFPFGTPEPGNYSAPVYFNGTVIFSPVADAIQAFALSNGRLPTSATTRTSRIFSYPGGTMSVSASGTTNGILWALDRRSNAPGALRAYDATNLSVELYNSDQAGSRDAIDEVVKFSAPLIANGKVYLATASKLWIFGLIQ